MIVTDDSWMDNVADDFESYEHYILLDIEHSMVYAEYQAARNAGKNYNIDTMSWEDGYE
jgi:hypothetical protein